MYIEGISLENFSTLTKTNINSTTPSRQRHEVFHSFLSDDSKHDADTTTAHIKRLISLIKYKTKLTTALSTIWENTYGCTKQYRCAYVLYIMSVMSPCYFIIIDQGISAPGNGKEVVDELNAIDKRYIYQLMSTVQLTGSNRFDEQMQIHTGTQKDDVSLAQELQQHLTKNHCKDGVIYQQKYKNSSWKENG